MSYAVLTTTVADRQIAGLRGSRRRAYDAFEADLARNGCRALSYRLTGAEPLPSLCVKHLRGKDRVVVSFVGDEAWILLVGPHDRADEVNDVYTALYTLTGVDPPTAPRTKPSCCDEAGAEPDLDQDAIADLVNSARQLFR